MKRVTLLSTAALFVLVSCATAPPVATRAELFLPGIVSNDDINVRITFSPDEKRMLWGVIAQNDPNGFQIMESIRRGNEWSAPVPVSFNSAENDFDPSFAPDGSGVYFFSNRPGGLGKDDLYFVALDARSGKYGTSQNLGGGINSPGDEWAPVVSRDGRTLLFSTDGRGGAGKHDLFVSTRTAEGWGEPQNIEAINTAAEEFDAAFLGDGRSIVFTSGEFDGVVQLFVARHQGAGYAAREVLPAEINFADAWTLGPSVRSSEPGVLYFTSHRAGDPARSNIYRIRYEAR
jgi:Tol biopolymer transport system component